MLSFLELNYWENRLTNLRNISEQIQNPGAYRMIKVLEYTKSAYYPGFQRICERIQEGKYSQNI